MQKQLFVFVYTMIITFIYGCGICLFSSSLSFLIYEYERSFHSLCRGRKCCALQVKADTCHLYEAVYTLK